MKKKPQELFRLAREALLRAGEGVRVPGSKRLASERKLQQKGIEVADELLAKIEKLCTT